MNKQVLFQPLLRPYRWPAIEVRVGDYFIREPAGKHHRWFYFEGIITKINDNGTFDYSGAGHLKAHVHYGQAEGEMPSFRYCRIRKKHKGWHYKQTSTGMTNTLGYWG